MFIILCILYGYRRTQILFSQQVLVSKHLAKELEKITLEDDDILNSHDVSLFTNTPVDQVLEIVKHRLKKENTLKEYNKQHGFNLDSEDVVNLLEFIIFNHHLFYI